MQWTPCSGRVLSQLSSSLFIWTSLDTVRKTRTTNSKVSIIQIQDNYKRFSVFQHTLFGGAAKVVWLFLSSDANNKFHIRMFLQCSLYEVKLYLKITMHMGHDRLHLCLQYTGKNMSISSLPLLLRNLLVHQNNSLGCWVISSTNCCTCIYLKKQ